MIIKAISAFSVDKTLERLIQLIEQKGLQVFTTIDHQQGALDAGLILRPTTVLIFGNPKIGTALIQNKQSIALDLPMKILVGEDSTGEPW
ncbi:MAG: DUF302 domain-containing protein [Bacteroidetes bacterium]|nr:DUF302 domain-containing protein [Bacteroidota bacterium]